MLKYKFSNIILFLFIKYIIFSIILAFLDGRFKSLILENSDNSQELIINLIYYIIYILIFSIVSSLLLSIPLYFTFKVKNILFLVLLTLFIVVEYFSYTYFASQTDLINGIYNGILSLVLFFIFFYKVIPLGIKD